MHMRGWIERVVALCHSKLEDCCQLGSSASTPMAKSHSFAASVGIYGPTSQGRLLLSSRPPLGQRPHQLGQGQHRVVKGWHAAHVAIGKRAVVLAFLALRLKHFKRALLRVGGLRRRTEGASPPNCREPAARGLAVCRISMAPGCPKSPMLSTRTPAKRSLANCRWTIGRPSRAG